MRVLKEPKIQQNCAKRTLKCNIMCLLNTVYHKNTVEYTYKRRKNKWLASGPCTQTWGPG